MHVLNWLASVRARALPAQSSGGGFGRGAEPPSEDFTVAIGRVGRATVLRGL